jgi:hypothetical protein
MTLLERYLVFYIYKLGQSYISVGSAFLDSTKNTQPKTFTSVLSIHGLFFLGITP